LKYRRLRGDMIEVYKILHDSSVAPELPRNVSSTKGNKYKSQNHSFHYNFRKCSFAARVVNVWNSLPDHVVDINSFKQFETVVFLFHLLSTTSKPFSSLSILG